MPGYSFAGGTTDGPGAFDFTQGNNNTSQNPLWEIVKGADIHCVIPMICSVHSILRFRSLCHANSNEGANRLPLPETHSLQHWCTFCLV